MNEQAAVSIIWNVAEFICVLVRGGHRGIHPGAIVAIDLVLWGGYIAAIFVYSSIFYYFDFDEYSSWYFNEGGWSLNDLYRYYKLEKAATICVAVDM